MNIMPKPEKMVDEKAREKIVATPKAEKQSLYVVDKEVQEEMVAKPEKEKPPFYADITFWIRVAMVGLLAMIAFYYLSL